VTSPGPSAADCRRRGGLPFFALLMTLGVLIALAALPAAAAPPPKIALVGGRIIPVRGEEIAKGTILIENGRITAVGETVELPYDAMEIDCAGKVLFPGMIDPFNWRGLDIPNEAVPVAPFLDVADAIDPARLFFEETLRAGITAVHISHDHDTVIGSVSRVLRPIGLTPEEMTLLSPAAIQIATSPRRGSDRMQQLAELREAFLALDAHLAVVAERRYEEERKKEGKKVDVPPAEARERGRLLVRDVDLDDQFRNLHRLRAGAIAPWLYAGAATDVAPAVEIARAQGLIERAVWLIGADVHRSHRAHPRPLHRRDRRDLLAVGAPRCRDRVRAPTEPRWLAPRALPRLPGCALRARGDPAQCRAARDHSPPRAHHRTRGRTRLPRDRQAR
jgi:hypothetical protein